MSFSDYITKYGLVSVMIPSDNSSLHDKFRNYMENEKVVEKLDNINTTWIISFNDSETFSECSKKAEKIIRRCAKKAKIEEINYAMAIQKNKPKVEEITSI